MPITYFKSKAEFRRWLEANHDGAQELLLGFYKKDSGKAGITYAEALDEALCYGWIDGIRRRVDDLSYMIRFTPRRPRSVWSRVNLRRVEELKKLKRMKPSGLRVHEARDPNKCEIYSFENRPRALEPVYEAEFQKNPKAWAFFQAQPPGYQRTACWWVMSARQEETRWRRLARLIADSGSALRLDGRGTTAARPSKSSDGIDLAL
jgi:uncharacterized protein YdeI (YjbR/CyaY-like superfamily)